MRQGYAVRREAPRHYCHLVCAPSAERSCSVCSRSCGASIRRYSAKLRGKPVHVTAPSVSFNRESKSCHSRPSASTSSTSSSTARSRRSLTSLAFAASPPSARTVGLSRLRPRTAACIVAEESLPVSPARCASRSLYDQPSSGLGMLQCAGLTFFATRRISARLRRSSAAMGSTHSAKTLRRDFPTLLSSHAVGTRSYHCATWLRPSRWPQRTGALVAAAHVSSERPSLVPGSFTPADLG
jgi:hypothetical protein